MPTGDSRLQRKVDETRAVAAERGLELRRGPLLATFEMPIWGASIVTHEIAELARRPGTAVAVISADALPEIRQAASCEPSLHVVAERGLVCELSGGRTVSVYPACRQELESFAVALFAGIAPHGTSLSLSGCVSGGRQEVMFAGPHSGAPPTALELQHSIRHHGGVGTLAGDRDEFVVVDDLPYQLDAVRCALNTDYRGRPVRVSRMPSGRFRLQPGAAPRPLEMGRAHTIAQEIAMSCDRFVDARGRTTFGFVTEPVAKREYTPEQGARCLARELFGAPDTVITHLGLQPFSAEGSLFFAYEGSESLWDAAHRGIATITVRDLMEYARILEMIRAGS